MRAPITPLVPPYHPQAAPLSGYGDIKTGTYIHRIILATHGPCSKGYLAVQV